MKFVYDPQKQAGVHDGDSDDRECCATSAGK